MRDCKSFFPITGPSDVQALISVIALFLKDSCFTEICISVCVILRESLSRVISDFTIRASVTILSEGVNAMLRETLEKILATSSEICQSNPSIAQLVRESVNLYIAVKDLMLPDISVQFELMSGFLSTSFDEVTFGQNLLTARILEAMCQPSVLELLQFQKTDAVISSLLKIIEKIITSSVEQSLRFSEADSNKCVRVLTQFVLAKLASTSKSVHSAADAAASATHLDSLIDLADLLLTSAKHVMGCLVQNKSITHFLSDIQAISDVLSDGHARSVSYLTLLSLASFSGWCLSEVLRTAFTKRLILPSSVLLLREKIMRLQTGLQTGGSATQVMSLSASVDTLPERELTFDEIRASLPVIESVRGEAQAQALAQAQLRRTCPVFSSVLKNNSIALSKDSITATGKNAQRSHVLVETCVCSNPASNGNYFEISIISCLPGCDEEFVGIGK